MPGPSFLPAVLTGLVDGLTTLLPTVQIVDGPYLQTPSGPFLTVGWTPSDTDTANADREPRSDGGDWTKEDFEIACYLDTAGGESGSNTEVAVRRAGNYALLEQIAGWLLADPTVGGATVPAGETDGWAVRLTRHRLHIDKNESGLAVGIAFYLTCSTVI